MCKREVTILIWMLCRFFYSFFFYVFAWCACPFALQKNIKNKTDPTTILPVKNKKHSFAKPTNLVNLNRPVQFRHAWRACHHDLRFFLLSLLCRKNQGKFGSPFLTDILKNANKKYFSIFRSFIKKKYIYTQMSIRCGQTKNKFQFEEFSARWYR